MGWFARFKRPSSRPDPLLAAQGALIHDSRKAGLIRLLAEMRLGPVGTWVAADGDPVIGQTVWRFWPDGRGECREYGVFGYPSEEPIRFEWATAGDWLIRVRESDGSGGEPEPIWQTVGFACRIEEAWWPSLLMADAPGRPPEAFGRWLCYSTAPVEWRGPPSPVVAESS